MSIATDILTTLDVPFDEMAFSLTVTCTRDQKPFPTGLYSRPGRALAEKILKFLKSERNHANAKQQPAFDSILSNKKGDGSSERLFFVISGCSGGPELKFSLYSRDGVLRFGAAGGADRIPFDPDAWDGMLDVAVFHLER